MPIDRFTGKRISEKESVRQSLIDIISTPKGSRPLNREYGSNLYKLIDQNTNDLMDFYIEVGGALSKQEPRYELDSVNVESVKGKTKIDVKGFFENEPLDVEFDYGLES